MPEAWFNVAPHLPVPLPLPLHPSTRQPAGPADLASFLPGALIHQEVTAAPWVDVPGEVIDVLRTWRPTPLVRARRLEQALATPARIYFKDESVSPTGSDRPNTAVAQAFYSRQEGVARLATATRSGRWGSALALACALFDLECTAYMGRASYDDEPHRRSMIETWGGSVVPSDVPVRDAVDDAATNADTHYASGSLPNHVLLHQTVIGLEAKDQLALAGEDGPDVVIGSSGGSGLAGIALPFVPDTTVRLMAVEPSSCPTLTSGRFDDLPGGDGGGGVAPILSVLVRSGRIEAVAYPHDKVRDAAVRFARAQGPIPSPHTAHAVRAAIDEALLAKEEGAERVILLSYASHGVFDG